MRWLCLILAFALPTAGATGLQIDNRDSAGLIRALQKAGAGGQPTRILLFPGGLYTLALTDSDGLALPPLRGEVIIEGRGAELRGWTHRPLHFLRVEPGARVVIRDLTLAEASDGALRNAGQLTLQRVVISDSLARGPSSIILNQGELQLHDSRIEFNLVHAPSGSAALMRNEGVLHIRNSSLDGNRITRTRAAPLEAAALWNRGEVHASAVSMRDNLLNDLMGSAELQTLVNVAGGRLSGHLLPR